MNKKELEHRIQALESESYDICSRLLSKKLVILPAGRFHRLAIMELGFFDIRVDILADASPETSWGRGDGWLFHDRMYVAEQTDGVIARYGNKVNYMITSRPFRAEIEMHLLESGICRDNIFYAPARMGGLVPRTPFKRRFEIWRAFEDIQEAADLLADEASRRELWDILAIFCTNAPVWREIPPVEEYFHMPFFYLKSHEVFVDAGMYDGATTKRFMEICPDYQCIYGFEANPRNMDTLYKNLDGYRNLAIYNNALCNKDAILKFGGMGEGARLSEKGDVEVKGIRGDSLNIAPTFIKFDVEGAEYDALFGFRHTIQRYKPKMAISAYHSLEDHWRLIRAVKDICPEYNLHLKHHYGYEDMYGTILYANI